MSSKPAFEWLLQEHSSEIFAYLWRLLRDTAEAEDVYQETFFRAFEAYPRLNDASHLRAWLYRIATNAANNHWRRQNREVGRTTRFAEALPDPAPSVQEQVETRLTLFEVLQAVEALPPRQRAALLLRKYQGLSYLEIGRVLGGSEDAARANVYQALRQLRDQFPGFSRNG